jgi:formate hydrogenlyase subunit 6/NADH:ubiquinone oxidoreductase subunit I
MKLTNMLGDVVRSLVRKPVTVLYPFEREPAPAALRGQLAWDVNKCTGCTLCVKDCPSRALELIVVDKAAKRYVMLYHEDRCTYCAQCVESCRFDALRLSPDKWELAALTTDGFAIYYGRKEDIKALQGKPELE